MAEKLSKTALKDELTRRVDWFEDLYGFNPNRNLIVEISNEHNKLKMYGRYLALLEMRYQIERNSFIGGYVC